MLQMLQVQRVIHGALLIKVTIVALPLHCPRPEVLARDLFQGSQKIIQQWWHQDI